jgi:hypothetical protein
MQHLIGASILISVTAEGSVPRRLHGQWLIAAFRASLNRHHIAWSAQNRDSNRFGGFVPVEGTLLRAGLLFPWKKFQ